MLTFWDIFNNPENTEKANISLGYSPTPSISFPPYTSPLSAGEKLKHHFKPVLLFAPFRDPAPEVLHSVRACNVDSISAAIRLHPLYQIGLFVIPPLLSPSSMPHLHMWPPSPTFPSVFVLPPLHSSPHSSLLFHPSVLLSHPAISPLQHSFDHRSFFPPPSLHPSSASIHFTPLHFPSPALPPGEPCKLLIQQSAAIKICNDIFEGKEACVVFNSYLMAVRLNSPLS